METERVEIDVIESNDFYRKLLSENDVEQDESIKLILSAAPVTLVAKAEGMFPLHVLAAMGSAKCIRRWISLDLSIIHENDGGKKFFEYLIRNLVFKNKSHDSDVQKNSYEDMVLLLGEVVSKHTQLLNQPIKKDPALPPLYDFLRRGYYDLARLFIDKGASLSKCDANGNNIFHVLVDSFDKDTMIYILEKMGHKRYLFKMNEKGLRPIHVAAQRSNLPAILGFYKPGGEDLLIQTESGETIFHIIIRNGDYGLLKNVFNQLKDDALLDETFDFKDYLDFVEKQMLLQPTKKESFERIKIFLKGQEKTAEDSRRHRSQKLKNVSFSGGGMKGAAFIGVLEALVKRDCIDGIQNVSGTSAGAIFGAFVCAGYRKREDLVNRFCKKMILDFFKEENPGFSAMLTQLLEPGKVKSILKNIFSGRLVAGLKKINKEQGLFAGDNFRAWIDQQLCDQIYLITGRGYKNLTLLELHKLSEEWPDDFKDLYVKTVNVDTRRLEEISWKTHPSVIVASAVRASAGFPIIFKPCHLFRRGIDGNPIAYSLDRYIDGGILDNNPVETFDIVGEGEFQSTVTNEGTVACKLVPTEEYYSESSQVTVKEDDENYNVLSFMKDFALCYFECESNKNQKLDNVRRTIDVPVSFSTWDINYTPSKMRELINVNADLAAKNADERLEEIQAAAFLRRIPTMFIAALAEHSSQPHLTNKDLKDLLLSSGSIRVKQYCPKVVYLLYKLFDKDDVDFLSRRLTIEERSFKDAIILAQDEEDELVARKIAAAIGEEKAQLNRTDSMSKLLKSCRFEQINPIVAERLQGRESLIRSR